MRAKVKTIRLFTTPEEIITIDRRWSMSTWYVEWLSCFCWRRFVAFQCLLLFFCDRSWNMCMKWVTVWDFCVLIPEIGPLPDQPDVRQASGRCCRVGRRGRWQCFRSRLQIKSSKTYFLSHCLSFNFEILPTLFEVLLMLMAFWKIKS